MKILDLFLWSPLNCQANLDKTYSCLILIYMYLKLPFCKPLLLVEILFLSFSESESWNKTCNQKLLFQGQENESRRAGFLLRYRPRFFDQDGHQLEIWNWNFFTISCNNQTYQNYEQSWQKMSIFLENKVLTLKIKVFKKKSFRKVDLLVKYSSQKKKIRKFLLIFDAEKWLWKYKFCKLWGGCS